VIVSAHALRLLLDLVGVDGSTRWFSSTAPLPAPLVAETMDRVGRHTAELTDLALCEAMSIDGLSCYGPAAGLPRSPLLAFSVTRVYPFALVEDLGREGVEARAGCHYATLAHRDLGMNPPASCRLSFAPTTVAKT